MHNRLGRFFLSETTYKIYLPITASKVWAVLKKKSVAFSLAVGGKN
jgi:uncharacterized membrane protein YjfL (UPF0719 family)